MLTLHHANHLEPLVERLLERVPGAAQGVFGADEVIVPSAAMRRHLTLSLARRHGVAAGVRFSYLAHWLWTQVARVVPGVSRESPFETEVITWRVLEAFEDAPWADAHPRLSQWLLQADPVMRLELATTVARMVDQAITYRPDWLARWAEGDHVPELEGDAQGRADEAWQAALWRRLLQASGAGLRHPAQDFADTLRTMSASRARACGLPAEVHVFGLPAIAPQHLGMLAACARVAEVHLYALNPCREFWFDVVEGRRLRALAGRPGSELLCEGHRLLAAWGRTTQSHLARLIDACGDDALDEPAFVDNPGHTLLGRWQNSVLDLQDLAPGSVRSAPDDRSVELHVCHSLTRELEALHDRLLGLFRDDASLQPSDILVVTPDLDAAAPQVEAVFGAAAPELHIPYNLTGLGATRTNPAAAGMADLLALAGSRFVAAEVACWLAQPMVARRFGFEPQDLDLMQTWLRDAGARWALDGPHRARFDLPAQGRHTLDDGLERLFLGYAMPQDACTPFDARLQAGDATGTRAPALGAMWLALGSLRAWRERLGRPHPAVAWPGLLREALDDLFEPEGPEVEDLLAVRAAIDAWHGHLERAGLASDLAPALVRHALQAALDEPARGGVPGGGVTFAAMGSLRGLPYRVVCMIGMDDAAFPGRERPSEFDLMARHPRPGDRQRRLDDRNLFLDLLLAARDRVHLSHTWRGIHDDAPRPASLVVDEWLDELARATADDPADARAVRAARERLIVAHPLQPFDERVFDARGDRRLASFQREHFEALARVGQATPGGALRPGGAVADVADGNGHDDDSQDDERPAVTGLPDDRPLFTAPLPTPGAPWRDVPLDRLLRFFRHPARFLLKERLGIALDRAEEVLPEDEPFLADKAAERALARRLLPALLQGASEDEATRLALAGTELPDGAFGQHALGAHMAAWRAFADRLAPRLQPPTLAPHTADFECELEGERWRLEGVFTDLRPQGLVRWHHTPLRAVDRLDAWIHHLLLQVAPPDAAATRVTWCGSDTTLVLEGGCGPRDHLRVLLALYRRGLREPLPYAAQTSWAYVRSGDRVATARSEWEPTTHKPWAEGADEAWRLAMRGRADPLRDGLADFHAVAHAVLDPLVAHLRDAAAPHPHDMQGCAEAAS